MEAHMGRKITRDELIFLLDELNRGAMSDDAIEEMVMELEFIVSDTEAIELLRNQYLSPDEIADQLVGYSQRDV
jgi:hypothetical protein